MIGKACLAGALALVLNPVEQAQLPAPTFIANDYIERISCAEGSGTGFKLASGQWVSVWHVVKLTGCQIDGLPILVLEHDERGDFAIFTIPGDNRRGGFEVDCAGFKDRQWYHAQGHALGLPVIRSIPIMAAHVLSHLGENRGWAVLAYNNVIPGQSGGPVVNQDGEATGTVNAYHLIWPISYSRALKDTSLCSS
jgi:hypothetical protein